MLGPMLGAGNTKRHRLIPGGDRQLMCVLTGQGGVAVPSALSTQGPEGLILPRVSGRTSQKRKIAHWVLRIEQEFTRHWESG